MKGEIDKDFYCSAKAYEFGYCGYGEPDKRCERDECKNYHRKHPTPEQYRKEYGIDYPDDGAVYVLIFDSKWEVYRYDTFKDENIAIVCARTPWIKPPADWRPK